MKTEAPIAIGEITNTCTCVQVDDDGEPTDEYVSHCYGDCWQESVWDFTEVTNDFRKTNETDWWEVSNLRLWNGDVSGYFHADKVEELLHGMAVRGEWHMKYEVYADRVEYSLSHHDAPTGSATVLRGVSEEKVEELGLYEG